MNLSHMTINTLVWFNINLRGLFNVRQQLTHCWRDKGVLAFPKSTSLKLNIIARLEFQLDYFEAAVQHFSYYAKETLIYISQLIYIYVFAYCPVIIVQARFVNGYFKTLGKLVLHNSLTSHSNLHFKMLTRNIVSVFVYFGFFSFLSSVFMSTHMCTWIYVSVYIDIRIYVLTFERDIFKEKHTSLGFGLVWFGCLFTVFVFVFLNGISIFMGY